MNSLHVYLLHYMNSPLHVYLLHYINSPLHVYLHTPLQRYLCLVPTENTCYLKTQVNGSWAEARAECQDWGGELAFPLPATNTTPHSWMQDKEEVWLAGSTHQIARSETRYRPLRGVQKKLVT